MEDETQAIGSATCTLLEWCWSNNMAFEFKYRVFPGSDELVFSPTLDLNIRFKQGGNTQGPIQ